MVCRLNWLKIWRDWMENKILKGFWTYKWWDKQHHWRREWGVERETCRKRESPRALRGRSEKCRQMLEDVPEAFSLLQCVILSYQAERERQWQAQTRNTQIEAELRYQWSAWINANLVCRCKHICIHVYIYGHKHESYTPTQTQNVVSFALHYHLLVIVQLAGFLTQSRNFARLA